MKKFILVSLCVFVVNLILDCVIHNLILGSTYQNLAHLWRSDMQSKMWLMWISNFCISFLFTYIFSKGYEGKGICEGLRFGLIVGLLVSIPMSLGTYAMIEIPFSLALQWFLYTTLQMILLGVVVAFGYGFKGCKCCCEPKQP